MIQHSFDAVTENTYRHIAHPLKECNNKHVALSWFQHSEIKMWCKTNIGKPKGQGEVK